MARAGPGAAGRAGMLLALGTLAVPLAVIGLVALGRPNPPPVVTPVPAAPIESPPIESPPIAGPPAAVLPPPPVVSTPAPTPTPQPINPFPRWTREDSLNFLVVGIDRRTPDEIYRTDSVVLANVDLRAGRATLISIPRDLLVDIPGYGQDRINAAYGVGENEHRPGGGLALLRETVRRNFGVPVNHYAVVDFNCFRGAVDALGGVTLTVPQRIYDPHYPTDDYGYQVVTFEPGLQWMDGERALEYARTRYGDTDFGRMRRQQQLLEALREQALQVRSLAALPQAVGACSGMASDLNILDLVALGSAAREIKPSDISMRVIDERMATPYTTPLGAAVLLPRWDAIRAMVRASIPSVTASASVTN